MDADRGNTLVTERMLWTGDFGPHTSIVGNLIRPALSGLEQEFYRFYYDQHLNRNGREYFHGCQGSCRLLLSSRLRPK